MSRNAAPVKRRAIISLGTNTIRLLVVNREANGNLVPFEHHAKGTRLGEGLGANGTLATAAMERTLEAVGTFAERARAHEAELVCIATSVMRRADDADAFAQRVAALTGTPLRIIGGVEEAEASFRGATAAGLSGAGERVVVLDIGGGSTECAVGSSGDLERSVSVEIGTVRLTESFVALDGSQPGAPAFAAACRAREAVSQLLCPLAEFVPIVELLAVAGTPATLAAIELGSEVDRVSGAMLSRERIAVLLERLLDVGIEERRAMPGMLPQRADLLAAGAIILDEAMARLGVTRVRVESNDLLLGYLLGLETRMV